MKHLLLFLLAFPPMHCPPVDDPACDNELDNCERELAECTDEYRKQREKLNETRHNLGVCLQAVEDLKKLCDGTKGTRLMTDYGYRSDPERYQLPETGIYIRGLRADTEEYGPIDLAHLDRQSVLEWLTSKPGLSFQVCLVLLGHNPPEDVRL